MEQETKGGMAVDQAFESVRCRVFHMCYAFAEKKRMRHKLDDVLSEAGELFCRAWQTWDPDMGTLSLWVHWTVKHGLDSWLREEIKRTKRLEWINGHDYPSAASFTLDGLMEQVGKDARKAVETAMAKYIGVSPQGAPLRLRLIRNLMIRGWSGHRIQEAFDEIREVLR